MSGMLRASKPAGYHAYARHHAPAPSPYQENRHKHSRCTCDQPHRTSRNGHQLCPSRYDRPYIDHHPSFQRKHSRSGDHTVAPQYIVPRPQYAAVPNRYHAECTCNDHAHNEQFRLASSDSVPTHDIQHSVSEHQLQVEKALKIGKQSVSVRENHPPPFRPLDIVELEEVFPKTYAKEIDTHGLWRDQETGFKPVPKARTNSTTSTHSLESTSHYRFTNFEAEKNASVAILAQDSQPLDILPEYFSRFTPEYFGNDMPDPEYYVASPPEAVWVVYPLPGIDFISVIRSRTQEGSGQFSYSTQELGTTGFPFSHKPVPIFGDNIWSRDSDPWKNQSRNQYCSFPWADPMKTAEDKVALWDTAVNNGLV